MSVTTVLERRSIVLCATCFGFNCKLSSDTDKNMWRKYTHNTILLNRLISQPHIVYKCL